MAMGTRRRRQRQEELWYRRDLAEAPGHPFYRRLNEVLDHAGFDEFCAAQCHKFYHERLGRPSTAWGVRAERFGLPSAVLGIPAVRWFNHWARTKTGAAAKTIRIQMFRLRIEAVHLS